MARSVCDEALLAYFVLPPRMIQRLMKICINEISYILLLLSYPSTLKWSDDWRKSGFDPTVDGYSNNQILNPLAPLILSFHLKWSDGCEDSQRRSTIKDGCGTTTCQWFNSSPKLHNLKLCTIGESTIIVDLWGYNIWRSWLIAGLERLWYLILLPISAIYLCRWSSDCASDGHNSIRLNQIACWINHSRRYLILWDLTI